MNWKNRVALITGASSGIGAALAVELGRRGAALGLIARRADELEKAAREIEAAGGRVLALPCDVRDARAVKDAAEALRSQFGEIDLLIANAGVAATRAVDDFSAEEIERVISINVIGAANSVAAVLPQMIERGSGHLVAISSLAASRGLPKSAAYCASKAAMSAFFESLRVDLRASGIDVTIIHPGFIKTPLTAGRRAKMPYLMELDDAAQKIMRAIESRKTSYWFPFPLSTFVRAMRLAPDSIYDRIAARRSYRE